MLAGYLAERLLREPQVQLTLLGRRLPTNLPLGSEERVNFQLFDYPDAPLDLPLLLTHNALVYCAAAGVQARHQIPAATVAAINHEVPASLLAALSQQQYAGRWLSFGSYFELGAVPASGAATEDDVVTAAWPVADGYSASKRQLTAFVAGQPLPFPAWHLVLPTIYGAHENADRLIPYLVRSLRQGEPLHLSAGTQVRQYLHGRDVADLSARLLLGQPVPGGIYNVAGPDVLAIKDLVGQVFAQFGQSAESALGTVQTRDESMPVLHLSGHKLLTALPEWQPRHTLASSLAEYL
jgi:nucleoside-diphosphate-sugar epimerase